MAKARNRWVDYLVYLLVRWLVCFIQALPFTTACSLAGFLAWVIYQVDRRHRRVAADNLGHAFPEAVDPVRRDRLVRAVYRHFCLMLIEIIFLPRRLHPNNWRRHMEIPHGRQMVDSLLSDRPLLFVTGHFGNWEMGGYVLALLDFPPHSIARKLDNPYLHRFLLQIRQRTGQTILDKKEDFAQMQAVLAQGGALATLGDQDAGQRGLFVDFFGRPASTHKAVALFALEYRVPLMVIGTPRVGPPMHCRALVEDLILPEEYDGQPDAVRAITQRFTAALERLARQYPEQYFWLHRRWKHAPPKSRRKVA
jgi:KDO2-lipid IV(A) lauroyltransferase